MKTPDWAATQAVVEAQQHLLFQSDVELVFEKNIARARTSGNDRWAAQLEQHLELLRAFVSVTFLFHSISASALQCSVHPEKHRVISD